MFLKREIDGYCGLVCTPAWRFDAVILPARYLTTFYMQLEFE